MRIGQVIVGVALMAAQGLSAADVRPDFNALFTSAPPDIAILGEVHDNPAHHQAQVQALAALRPKAVVFEMLTPDQAARAAGLAPGDSDGLATTFDWDNSGWPDFALYAPVFAATPSGGIRGAALPRDEVRRAMTEGAAAVFGVEADAYGLSTPLPADQQAALEAEIAEDHCGALPADMLPGMIEAQRLRDAAFARATLAALRETGGPVALITGTGHARKDRAVPAYLARVAPEAKVFVLGQGECEGAACLDRPADLYDVEVLTAPTPRPDPCEAFRKP